jgi:hypothetical protein
VVSLEEKKQVRSMLDDTLERYRQKLEEAEGVSSTSPLLRAFIEPDVHAFFPQPFASPGRPIDFLVMQMLLQALGAKAYALAMEVGVESPTPRRAVHVCSGIAGWDTATAQIFDFKNERMRIRRTVSGDCDKPRDRALASVPNLLEPPDFSQLTATERASAEQYVQRIIAAYRFRAASK